MISTCGRILTTAIVVSNQTSLVYYNLVPIQQSFVPGVLFELDKFCAIENGVFWGGLNHD